MLGKSILRNSLILGIFACITAGVIAVTFFFTKGNIETQKETARTKALLEILPQHTHDNNLLDDSIELSDETLIGTSNEKYYMYFAKINNQITAVILPVIAPDGYGGRIHLLVGINQNGTIAGVRATQHNETPGLGDKIELKKSEWVLSFNGKSLVDPTKDGWQVKKDGGEFDQFTGATITPRAVVNAVYSALNYFESNKELLLNYEFEKQSENHTK